MKNNHLFAIALVFLVMAVSPVSAAYPKVIVSGFSVKDGNVAVGEDFTLSVNLTNIMDECAYSIITTVKDSSPFVVRGLSSVQSGELCTGTKTIDIPLSVLSTATGGKYTLSITNSYESFIRTQYSNSDTLNIVVNGKPDLSAHITASNPVDVYSGDTATITISLENDGTFEAQDVDATLTSEGPIITKWSSRFMSAGMIGARQSKSGQFTVEVPKDASAKTYPLSLKVNYLDENRIKKTVIFPLNFTVKKKAQFKASDSSSNNLYAGDSSKIVRLTLTNTGSDAAKNVKIKIEPQFPFSTDGSVRYIDSLKPGESAGIDFIAYVDKDATIGDYGLTLLINFEDAQGKTLSDTTDFRLTVKKKNIIQSVFLDYWFLWLVAIAIAVMVMREKKTKKKK